MLTVDVNDATTGTVLASRMIRKSDILTEYLAALDDISGAPYANYDLSFLLNSYRRVRFKFRASQFGVLQKGPKSVGRVDNCVARNAKTASAVA